jgi:hypothetical protein
MEVLDYKPDFEGWRSVLVPVREPRQRAEARGTLKEQCLIGTIVFGLVVLTPAWIALCGWLCLCLARWLMGA